MLQRDPVCAMIVDEKKTKFYSNFEGKNFYFCSGACKATFDKSPRTYATK